MTHADARPEANLAAWVEGMLSGEVALDCNIVDVAPTKFESVGNSSLEPWVEAMHRGEVAIGQHWCDLVSEPLTVVGLGEHESIKTVVKGPPVVRRRASRRASCVAVPIPEVIRMELIVTQRRIDELQARPTLKNPYKLVYLRTRLANLEEQLKDSEEQWERSKSPAGVMKTWEEEDINTDAEELRQWFDNMLQGEISPGKGIWDLTPGGLCNEIMGGITMRSWYEAMRTGQVCLDKKWMDLASEPASIWGDDHQQLKRPHPAPVRRKASRRASCVAVPIPEVIRMELIVTQRRIDELQARPTLKNPYKLVYLRTRLANLEEQLKDSEEQWERSKSSAGVLKMWEEEEAADEDTVHATRGTAGKNEASIDTRDSEHDEGQVTPLPYRTFCH